MMSPSISQVGCTREERSRLPPTMVASDIRMVMRAFHCTRPWIHHCPDWLGWLFSIFLVIYVANSINLIDGIDGLASGLSMIALIFYSIESSPS